MNLLKFPSKISFFAAAIALFHCNITTAADIVISTDTVGGQNFFTGTNSIQINNNVTLSATNQNAIYVGGGSLSILNYGTISTNYYVIQNQGTISSLINEGRIASSSGILNLGTIGTLTNTGEISPYIINQFDIPTPIITTINNLQGGAPATTALGYSNSSTLPTHYNIIINSPANYGELSASHATGTMAFNIYGNTGTTLVNGVSASSVVAGTYADVLQGFSSLAGITGTTGTYSGMSYSLVADTAHSNMWNLVFVSLSTNMVSGIYQSSNLGGSVNPKFDGGTLQVSSAGTISTPLTITINGGTIDQNGLDSDFSGAITNDSAGAAGKLAITNTGAAGQGSVTLSGVNTYTGGTQVNAGANLIIHSGSALGSGSLALRGSATVPATLSTTATTAISNAITVEGDPVFNVASGTTTSIMSQITDGGSSGDVVVNGGGTLALMAANTYTGLTEISAGSTLALIDSGSIASSSGLTNAGTFDIHNIANNVSLAGFSQASSGVLAMSFASINNQELLVNGSASLAGALSLTAAPGTYTAGHYTLLNSKGLLTGSFSKLAIASLSNYTNLGYSLSYDAHNVYLNLLPNLMDTQASLQANVGAMQGVYAIQTGTINNSLNYDCNHFGRNGVCLSTGGRYSNASESSANTTSAMLIGAYQISGTMRVGGYIDQNLYNTDVANIASMHSNSPFLGTFAVWNQHANGTGIEAKLAAGYNNSDLTIKRVAMGTSESGYGTTGLNTVSGSATVSYGFKVTPNWLTSPYAGFRHTSVFSGGYSEQATAAVTAPLTYNALTQESTSALLGIRLTGHVFEHATIQTSAGFEQDLQNAVGNYSATGLAGLTDITFNPNIRRTRAVTSFGASYDLGGNHRLGFNAIYRQESFQSVDTKMAYVNYSIGF
jgi:autotransporter-associated beta strand protein